jgi:hypothetical protein
MQEVAKKRVAWNKGKKTNKPSWNRGVPNSPETRRKISEHHKKHGIIPPYQFNKDSKNYSTLHKWLVSEYGRADRCENPDCKGISENYDYALIKGHEYSRDREDYTMLCRSCHIKYDMTDERKERIIKNFIWNIHL